MISITSKQGFGSIIEVTIAAIIFTIAAFGLMSSITMLSPETAISSQRLEAAYIGRSLLDELRSDVDASSNWLDAGHPLYSGTTINRTISLGTIQYNVSYRLEDIPGLDVRRMTMNIEYPDD
ncbi:MAG: Tfp pilus assembly protein PilV [Lysobacterales bacterium]|jgi:Tfp pilus assembly protein PilV